MPRARAPRCACRGWARQDDAEPAVTRPACGRGPLAALPLAHRRLARAVRRSDSSLSGTERLRRARIMHGQRAGQHVRRICREISPPGYCHGAAGAQCGVLCAITRDLTLDGGHGCRTKRQV